MRPHYCQRGSVRLNIARVAEDPVRAARLPEGPSRMTFYSGGDWDPVSMEGRDRVRVY